MTKPLLNFAGTISESNSKIVLCLPNILAISSTHVELPEVRPELSCKMPAVDAHGPADPSLIKPKNGP